jgi:murein DD-endopeptidase MepM/ murein hydrolase activator NlpD
MVAFILGVRLQGHLQGFRGVGRIVARRLMRFRVALACVILPLCLWAVLPVGVLGQGNLQRKIDTTRAKIGKKKGAERVLTSEIAAYTARIRRLENRIGSLQRREQALQADLDRKRAALVRTQSRLRDERARLARLRARLKVAREALATRLVEMYKAERPDILTVVLNADGFADLLSRGEFIRRIADQDRRIVERVRAAKAEATATEARLDRLENKQQKITAQVLARRNEVALVKKELIGTRVGYRKTQADKQRALQKVRVDRQELESHLKSLEREQAKIQARLAAARGQAPGAPGAGPIKRGSSGLIWPANGPISSGFGQRWGRLHAGVDIPLPNGTPLRAADGGRVAIAGWVGGYGNYTCIQHTASLSTCYGHQSSIGVSVGQTVSQGQVIGRSGNTGNSTGPHLHFEVRVNGSPVNPLGYL